MVTSLGASTVGLPADLKKRDSKRLAKYKLYLAFYAGAQYTGIARGTKLRRLTVNYTRTFVRKISSYIMKGFAITVEPNGDSEEHRRLAAAAEDAWYEIAQNNGLTRIDMATEIDCATLGDAGYRVGWDAALKRVAITAIDVGSVYVWPHPTDPLQFTRLAYRYELTAEQLAVAFSGLYTGKTSTIVTEDWTDDGLNIWIDDENTPAIVLPNPYGFVPFVVYPNEQVPKEFWGESDIEPLMEMARELNNEYSRLSNLMELSGNPIAVLAGVDDASGVETFPGAIWTLPEDAKATVLDMLSSGAATAHLAYLEDVRRVMHDISEIPRTAFGGDTSRQLSGVALEVELEPLLQKAGRKRAIRGDAYRNRALMAFRISDQFADTTLADSGRITISWDALTPRDRTREIQDELALTGNAQPLSSRHSAMARLGVPDPDAEIARIEADAPEPVDTNA